MITLLACIGTPIGTSVTENVIVQVYCPGKSIVDLITSSPVGLTQSAITQTASSRSPLTNKSLSVISRLIFIRFIPNCP